MTKIALLLSHGQPSDPDPAEAALALLAAQVRGHLPGWQVVSATLAKPGALDAVAGGTPGLVYPMFMAGGWFTATESAAVAVLYSIALSAFYYKEIGP